MVWERKKKINLLFLFPFCVVEKEGEKKGMQKEIMNRLPADICLLVFDFFSFIHWCRLRIVSCSFAQTLSNTRITQRLRSRNHTLTIEYLREKKLGVFPGIPRVLPRPKAKAKAKSMEVEVFDWS